MAVNIPDDFDQMKGKDVTFEMTLSNSIQPLKLHFRSNIISDSIAYIFVCSEYDENLP